MSIPGLEWWLVAAAFVNMALITGYVLPVLDRLALNDRLMTRIYWWTMAYHPERFLFPKAIRQDERKWQQAGRRIFFWRRRVWLVITALVDAWLVYRLWKGC